MFSYSGVGSGGASDYDSGEEAEFALAVVHLGKHRGVVTSRHTAPPLLRRNLKVNPTKAAALVRWNVRMAQLGGELASGVRAVDLGASGTMRTLGFLNQYRTTDNHDMGVEYQIMRNQKLVNILPPSPSALSIPYHAC